jgi:hypothetical protein
MAPVTAQVMMTFLDFLATGFTPYAELVGRVARDAS